MGVDRSLRIDSGQREIAGKKITVIGRTITGTFSKKMKTDDRLERNLPEAEYRGSLRMPRAGQFLPGQTPEP